MGLAKMLTDLGRSLLDLLTDKQTGKRKGFGFIEMPGNDAAKAAIRALNVKEVYGRKLALSVGIEKEQERNEKFQRPRRENRDSGSNKEIDGNRW